MKNKLALIGVLGAFVTAPAFAVPLTAFSENFEGDLSAWTDRNPADPEAHIVADPLRAGNNVLSFRRRGSAGSIYTTNTITTTGDFTVSFEYLGLPSQDDMFDLGGFFGISLAFPGHHYWVAGTGSYPAPIPLIDDGQWHSHTLTFTSPIGQNVHLMFEDFISSGPVAGDVFFDNIQFNDSSLPPAPLGVPLPGALALLGAGLFGLGWRRRIS